MEAASVPAKLLGELFVERGLITPEELEEALAEQKVNGKRLGEVLVMKGYVSGPALTTMLAEQLGVEMEKQTGYGSGLWSEIKRRHPRGGRSKDNGASRAGPHVEREPRLELIDGLAAEVGVLVPAEGEEPDLEVADANAELDGLRQQLTFAANTLDEERKAHGGTQRLLEEARAEAERLATQAVEWKERAAQAEDADGKAAVAELRTELTARDSELAEGVQARTALEAEVVRLQAAVDNGHEQHYEAEEKVAAAKNELQELRAAFAAREAELAGNAASKAAMEAEVTRLEADLTKLRDQHSGSKDALGALTAQVDELREGATEAQRLLEEARTEAAALEAAIAELRPELEAARAERGESQATIAELRTELSAHAEAAQAHELELAQLREELVAQEGARSHEADARKAAEAELRQLQKDARVLSERFEEERAASAEARERLEETAAEAARLREIAAEAEKHKAELKEVRGLLEEERAKAATGAEIAQELAALRSELDKVRKERSDSQAAGTTLAEQLEQERACNEKVERKLDESRAEVAAFEATATELREELAAREQALSREAKSRTALEAELRALQLRAASLQEQADEAEELHRPAAQVHELEQELTVVRTMLTRHEQAAAKRNAELKALREQVEEEHGRAAAEAEGRSAVELQLAELRAVADALNERVQEESESHGATRQALGRVEAELAELQPLTDQLAATEHELSACAMLLEEVSEGLAATKARLGERDFSAADTSRHLVFVPVEGVYALAERSGPAPEIGTAEEVDGVSFRVSRIGPSPLPADRRRCAFLEVA